MKKQYTTAATALAIGIATAIPVFAADTTAHNQDMMGGFRSHFGQGKGEGDRNGKDVENRMMRPIVTGKVTAIAGNTITISGEAGIRMATSTTVATVFTIDATNAKVVKNGATSTVSSVLVGDNLFVQGTLNGTNVVATMIRDGNKMMPIRGGDQKNDLALQGNGQPIVAGSITAISGNTITVSNKSNIVYTVDATNSVIKLRNATSTVSSLTVGDQLVIQGGVNGTTVTASTILDSGTLQTNTTASGEHKSQGLLGGVFEFFTHIFGF